MTESRSDSRKSRGLGFMILGMGCDLVDSRRVDSLLKKYGNRFLNRICTELERGRILSRQNVSLGCSKVFAAKEAAMKAIGDPRGICWHDFEIDHNSFGKPILRVFGRALETLSKLHSGYQIQTHLSISDEPPYAQAFVVIDGY